LVEKVSAMTVYRARGKIGRLRTRIFEMEEGRDMKKLAILLRLSLSQVYRIKHGQRPIGEKFIVGALIAFPKYKFEDLFYVEEV